MLVMVDRCFASRCSPFIFVAVGLIDREFKRMRRFRPSPDNNHEPELRFLYVTVTLAGSGIWQTPIGHAVGWKNRRCSRSHDRADDSLFLCWWGDRFDAFGYMKHSRPAVFRQCDGQPGEFVNTRKGVYVLLLSLFRLSCWLQVRDADHFFSAL